MSQRQTRRAPYSLGIALTLAGGALLAIGEPAAAAAAQSRPDTVAPQISCVEGKVSGGTTPYPDGWASSCNAGVYQAVAYCLNLNTNQAYTIYGYALASPATSYAFCDGIDPVTGGKTNIISI